jgi:DNA-binding beta-propeller fold protein YncE
MKIMPFALLLAAGLAGAPDLPAAEWPGAKPDGATLLPNMWSLRPAGRQIPLGDFPVNIALHPGGRFAAVLHAGHGKHTLAILDLPGESVVTNQPVGEAWYGLAFSRDGSRLFVSGSSSEELQTFAFAEGALSQHKRIPLRPAKERGIPAGMAVTRDGKTAYVANVWGHRVSVVDLESATSVDIALTPSKPAIVTKLPKPSADPDLAAAEKRQQQLRDAAQADDPFPYTCLLDEQRGRLYVSLWAQAAVAVIDLKTRAVVARWPTQEHPNELLLTRDGQRLFVANANRNSVTVFDCGTGRASETLVATLTPDAPPGNTPNSLALTPDEGLLFVANANVNNVAVFDVSVPGHSRSLGFIPSGWYPTSVRVSLDGQQLFIANGKGGTSFANPRGPQPIKVAGASTAEYIGGLMKGTFGIVDLPRKRPDLEAALRGWTATAQACAPTGAARAPTNLPPVKYCIYVIKENRTYDQVFGDIKEGNGDPQLCIFPEKVTPNTHALARDFVLLDNFYCEGEVSADGHEWTMGAYATDFVEKFWPLSYGHGKSGKFPYPSEGGQPIATPAGGYLWDKAAEAQVSYRSYGEFCANIGKGGTGKLAKAKVPALVGHIDEYYRGFDMEYPDCKRVAHFAGELKKFEAAGEMPRLQVVRLGNDHTYGTSAGKLTPTAMVAENDLAVGQFVELLSHSKFWSQTAVFVIQDDAQNGPDHVDAHRTVALCISPYTRGRGKDSTMYSTCSMLRTMELLLGLKPMSQFDASATPMTAAFRATADHTPFVAKPANVSLTDRNSPLAWGAKEAAKMNFAKEDAADDLLLNEMVWRSVRGPDSPMPAPVRAAFVFSAASDDDD